jgi:S-adenosylmethionine hydrolase
MGRSPSENHVGAGTATVNKTIKDIDGDISRLTERVSQFESKFDERIKAAAEGAALKQILDLSNSIQDRIEKNFKTALILVSMFVLLLGGLGYFGAQTLISTAVKERFDNTVMTEMKSLQADLKTKSDEANTALRDIRAARSAITTNALIVLQTDYGSDNAYMGELKGEIYKINPNARIDLITSEVDKFDVINAAWILSLAAKHYPPTAIFVSITNPGGITTTPIVVLTKNGQIFIGHDNGCFDLVVDEFGHKATYTIANPEISPPEYKDMFGGADVFGPAAAYVSMGYELEKIGPRRSVYEHKLPGLSHKIRDGSAEVTAMDVDVYGNVTTYLSKDDLDTFGLRVGEKFVAKIGDRSVELTLRRTYADTPPGTPVAIMYEDYLQLAIDLGNFANVYGVKRGNIVGLVKEQGKP